MRLTKKKQVFVLLSFVFLVGFRLAHLDFNPPAMVPWSDDLNGQFVTPVSTVALFRSDKDRAEDIGYDEIRSLFADKQ